MGCNDFRAGRSASGARGTSFRGFESRLEGLERLKACLKAMARWALLVSALAEPECLRVGEIGRDPLMPSPNMYVPDLESCEKSCRESLLCQEFSFKQDTVPTSGGCWLFNEHVKLVKDVNASSGAKSCKETATAAPQIAGVDHAKSFLGSEKTDYTVLYCILGAGAAGVPWKESTFD